MSSWLLGRFIGLGPAGGKTTAATATDACDVERHVAWDELRGELTSGSPNHLALGNWEDSVDTVALFFRAPALVVLAELVRGRTALAHCIDYKSSWLAGRFLAGLRRSDALPIAGVAAPPDSDELERRVALRAPHRPGRAADWYESCHTLWAGLAVRLGMPTVALTVAVAPEGRALTGFHVCRFAALNQQWMLLEVLPRQYALYDGAEKMRGWYVANAASVLSRWPWVASEWGRAPAPWWRVEFDSRDVVLDSHERVPMLQTANAGLTFLPTWHLACPIDQPIEPLGTARRTLRPGGCARTNRAVLVYYGSFAPWHRGHLEVLELARATLVARGLQVMGAYVVPVETVRDDKHEACECLGSWTVRAAIAQLAVAHLGYVSVASVGDACVENVASRIQHAYGGGTAIVWVNGGDIQPTEYMQWLLDATDQVDLLFVPRAGSPAPTERADGRVVVTAAPTLRLSSTAVRRALLRGERSSVARMMCGSADSAYLEWAYHEVDLSGRDLGLD